MKERKEEIQEKYPWLGPSNQRKHLSDKEILDKYVDLDKSCLTDVEKKQVVDILYKYKVLCNVKPIGKCNGRMIQ